MVKLELYELKEALVDLNIDFNQNATRSELESLLTKSASEKVVEEVVKTEVVEVNRVASTTPTEDGLAQPLESSEKEKIVVKKKRYNRTTPVEENIVVNKNYIIVGNIKGYAKGSSFSGSEDQIKQLLEFGAIEEVTGD